MNRRKLDAETVVLVPSGDGAVQIGVGPAGNGMLRALLTISTETLGDFAVVLTKQDLALLAAGSRTLIAMDAEQVDRLRTDLERTNEGEEDE